LSTLLVVLGPDRGRSFQVREEPAIIGRTAADITLSDQSTSRRHAEIRPENGSWVLVDLQSSNGTFVNGQRVLSPITLRHGDHVRVGGTILLFSEQEHIETFTGADAIHDMVDLSIGQTDVEAAILTSVEAVEPGAVLQPSETADAVVARSVIVKIAEIIGANIDVKVLLQRVSDIVFEHLVADRLVVLSHEPETGALTPEVVRFRDHAPKTEGQRPKIVTSRTILEHVLAARGGVLCANAMTDTRFRGDGKHGSIHDLGLRSIICAPILVRDQILGVFHLDCSMSRYTYSQEQLRLLVAVGRLTGMAIENSRLQEHRVRTERLAATGETVAYLSHHIRNILQGLQGGAELVEMGLKRRHHETMLSGWNLVRRNLDRTLHLAKNMLTFSKDRRPRIETAQLNDIVREVVALSQTRAEEKGTVIQTRLEELPLLPMDPVGMHQVLHNILLNAIDAVPEQTGTVVIQTSFDPVGGELTVSITDNGPGIDPESLRTVFQVFQSSKGHSGTGLGLAAAKKIMDEMDGEITTSSAPGTGTTFHVRLAAVPVGSVDQDRTRELFSS